MPIYEYICTECTHQFESLQKLSDAPLSDCPSCERSALKKKISAPSFRLSGTGWYETDFKSDKQKNLTNAENGSKPSAKKSDDKPASTKADKGLAKKDSGSGKVAAA